MSRKILRNFNLSVDGFSYRGVVTDVTLPTLTIKSEDFRAGGMDAPIELDMGMEKLDMSFTLAGDHPEAIRNVGLRLFGYKLVQFRGALLDEDTGIVRAVKITAIGKVFEQSPGEVQPGAMQSKAYRMNLTRYQYEQDGVVIQNFDIPNNIRMVGGIDQNAEISRAIGI
jgi:uncharacterized protein